MKLIMIFPNRLVEQKCQKIKIFIIIEVDLNI